MTRSLPVDAACLPPATRLPSLVQGAAMLVSYRGTLARLRRRHGSCFTMRMPPFGDIVVVTEPALARQLFTTKPAVAGRPALNLGRVIGAGSIFTLDDDAHRRRRKLLTPPFHGRRLKAYEGLIEEEALREIRNWPQGQEMRTLEPFSRMTLNIILRAVFGATGANLDALRTLLPRVVILGSRLVLLPDNGLVHRLADPRARYRATRRRYDEIMDDLIATALADPRLDERDDVLAMLLQSRYEDGEPMPHRHVADELLSLLAAGHETTATTLAWTVERLGRHPDLLRRLVAEADAGGSELRQATILEVQRTRPVIAASSRQVKTASMQLGDYVIPRGHTVMVAIDQVQSDPVAFPDPERFDPDRFLDGTTDLSALIPFGGGTRRCPGAAFASLELEVILRTMFRELEWGTTTRRDERWHYRGVAFAPGRGGRLTFHRRIRPATATTDPATAAVMA